jgi:DNA repair protein RecO (recombination protein O)
VSGHAVRVELTPGLVLHQRPWRDTSLIVELFTLQHGRLTTFARGVRGAKGRNSRFLALRPFQPLLLSWFGRGEAPRLTAAEPDGVLFSLPPAALLSAWYLNELLLKLTTQHDPQPDVFHIYAQALHGLAGDGNPDWVLRRFEKQLLDKLGFGMEFSCAADGVAPILVDRHYRFIPGVGFEACQPGHARACSGRVLLGLAHDEPFALEADWREARNLMRAAIDHCLDGRELRTRQVARALVRVEGAVRG